MRIIKILTQVFLLGVAIILGGASLIVIGGALNPVTIIVAFMLHSFSFVLQLALFSLLGLAISALSYFLYLLLEEL